MKHRDTDKLPGEKPPALFGMTPHQLACLVEGWGLPAYRARQLCTWLYRRHAESVEVMSSLPVAMRTRLAAALPFGRVHPSGEAVSADGTRKYLFDFGGGRRVETAFIPSGKRATLCLSTQAGCARGCAFCMTGKQGLQGQLTAGEILNQFAACPFRDRVANLVLMGMGEPFDNTSAVLAALQVLCGREAYALSPSRITVSTVGVLPGMRHYLAATRAHLAVSLHNPFPDERAALVPAEKHYPIADVIRFLRGERDRFSGQRRLTFEYILFDGVNDSPRHARAVVSLLNGLRCRVNLISFNAFSGSGWRPSPPAAVAAFQQALLRRGLRTTVRVSRGADIDAACGLLSTR